MADGTGVKMRGGARGDLRVVIGLDGRNEPFPLGVYSGTSWEEIGPEIKARLKDRDQATLFVQDGEIGIDEHLSGIAEKTGRCRWHMPRGVKYALWGDGAGKDEQDAYARRLRGLLAVQVPADDWQELGADDLAPLRKELDDSRKAYERLVEEFGSRGYAKAREYLANAMGRARYRPTSVRRSHAGQGVHAGRDLARHGGRHAGDDLAARADHEGAGAAAQETRVRLDGRRSRADREDTSQEDPRAGRLGRALGEGREHTRRLPRRHSGGTYHGTLKYRMISNRC